MSGTSFSEAIRGLRGAGLWSSPYCIVGEREAQVLRGCVAGMVISKFGGPHEQSNE